MKAMESRKKYKFLHHAFYNWHSICFSNAVNKPHSCISVICLSY